MNDLELTRNAPSEFKQGSLLQEALMGLSKQQKTIPAKFLYDQRGSEIFEEICHLEEYYPTRVEMDILQMYAEEMSAVIGPRALVIEPGSGAGEKFRFLLSHLRDPAGYVPIEISSEILTRMSRRLHEDYPELKVIPVGADFTHRQEIPSSLYSYSGKKIVFFPGSTIGNFSPTEAISLIEEFGQIVGSGGGLLIGVDLKKDIEVLEKAYNDSRGMTAKFNLNILERLNREALGHFNAANFSHQAFYNKKLGRIELHLKSEIEQVVKVNGASFHFRKDETIHTENSYKYSRFEFVELCAKSHFQLMKYWQDDQKLFCVFYFERQTTY